MLGQAVVIIKDKQWTVTIANTFIDLSQGLSGVESMPPGAGMFFDLGSDYKTIRIDMSRMLFPLDIVFINSTQGVVGVLHNVPPGENASLQNDALPGARCFLEVNAGEADEIEVGDSVNIQGYTQSAQFDINTLVNFVAGGIILFLMVGAGMKTLEEPEEGAKPALPSPEEELQEKRQAFESKGREMAREAGVEFVKLAEGWQPKYATPRYWFRDARGKEIIATDLEELKWKASRGDKTW